VNERQCQHLEPGGVGRERQGLAGERVRFQWAEAAREQQTGCGSISNQEREREREREK
jgi:hypothetical protein